MPENPYESEKLVDEYLLFHFGTEAEILGGLPGPKDALDFPSRCVGELLADPCGPRALDVGCAVGRATFELAARCESVLGIDFSAAFIAAANQLKESGTRPFHAAVEGGIRTALEARVPADLPRERVQFETGDAMNLRPDLSGFDVVLAANLICRLPDPMRFLHRLPELVRAGGQLLLTTPFTWLEEFTPRAHWLGGRDDGSPRSFDALREILQPHFELQATRDLPFLIREHARKFQYGVALGSRWIRRGAR